MEVPLQWLSTTTITTITSWSWSAARGVVWAAWGRKGRVEHHYGLLRRRPLRLRGGRGRQSGAGLAGHRGSEQGREWEVSTRGLGVALRRAAGRGPTHCGLAVSASQARLSAGGLKSGGVQGATCLQGPEADPVEGTCTELHPAHW